MASTPLPCHACSVLFNFLGRDFFNALSEKDAERFTQMLVKWLGAVVLGVPVFVLRDYLQVSGCGDDDGGGPSPWPCLSVHARLGHP